LPPILMDLLHNTQRLLSAHYARRFPNFSRTNVEACEHLPNATTLGHAKHPQTGRTKICIIRSSLYLLARQANTHFQAPSLGMLTMERTMAMLMACAYMMYYVPLLTTIHPRQYRCNSSMRLLAHERQLLSPSARVGLNRSSRGRAPPKGSGLELPIDLPAPSSR